jgi:hypothetical protein
MARNALLSALQAAMLAGAGGVQGSIQARERERKKMLEDKELERRASMDAELLKQYQRQEAMDVINLLSSGKAVEVKPEPAGLPPSVIPLPRADQVGGRSGVEMAGRKLAVLGADEFRQTQNQQALSQALALAEAQAPFQRELAAIPARAAASGRVAEDTAEQQRLTKKQDKDRLEGYQSLKAAGVNVPDPYNPSYRYEDEWAQYIKLPPFERGAAGGTFFPGFTGGKSRVPGADAPAAPAASKPSLQQRIDQLKAAGLSKTEAEAILKREGYTF